MRYYGRDPWKDTFASVVDLHERIGLLENPRQGRDLIDAAAEEMSPEDVQKVLNQD